MECATPLPGIKEAGPTKTLETPTEELTTGSIFAGRYQIIEELGKGGMGKVYKALDIKINEKIALKLIKPEIASNTKTIKRFGNELKTARKIGHRNVGRMYHLGEEHGTHFITMEFVPGEDLRSMIRMSGQLGIGTVISITKQICEGLSEAHRLGVVHRDLKSSNIMIDKQGQARIMDFGIARSLQEKGITGPGLMIGTPEYMSPEQAEGKEADQRSDIYAIGIILYEMITGRVPFEGGTPLSIALKHKTESPEDPRNLNIGIPENLQRIVLRCLEKSKENRFQNTEELLEKLKNIEELISSTEGVRLKEETKMSKEELALDTKRTRNGSKPKVYLAIAAIVPALLTFLVTSYFYSRNKKIEATPGLTSTISGKPLAAYPFYPITISKEGFPYIDRDLFMDAVNMLRENPDARAVADLIYMERKENITLQLSASDRRLFQALISEVPVPDATHQEEYIDRLFSVYKQIVNGIGQTFAGTPIEIVLHDIRNPMRSIQAIQNPISGRQLYQATTNFGIHLIKWYATHPQQGSNFISYNLKLADGTPIKSTTIPLYDPEYGLLGSICLNIRISDLSETDLDERTKQFLIAFRRTSENYEIEEIIDNAQKTLSQKQSEK
jgi:serine/threonine protein kinase/predicted transcriptional regulator YheO